MNTRRDFGRLALGATAIAALPASPLFAVPEAAVESVRLGATTWSLRDLPRVPGQDNIADIIKPLQAAGVTMIDLWSYNAEPAGPNTGPGAPPPPAVYPIKIKVFTPEEIVAALAQARELLRDYRMNTPAKHYEEIAGKFAAAGIKVAAYTVQFDDSFTDQELDIVFRQAKALGASSITSPGTASVVKRLAPVADKHEMDVSLTDFTLTSSLPSKRFKVNADVGAIAAANGSPVAWIQENHESIGQLTIKDRRRNKGANEKYGDGDTPINDVLKLVKDKKYSFPVFAEYEYLGLGTPGEELARCMDYMRDAIA